MGHIPHCTVESTELRHAPLSEHTALYNIKRKKCRKSLTPDSCSDASLLCSVVVCRSLYYIYIYITIRAYHGTTGRNGTRTFKIVAGRNRDICHSDQTGSDRTDLSKFRWDGTGQGNVLQKTNETGLDRGPVSFPTRHRSPIPSRKEGDGIFTRPSRKNGTARK